MRSQREAGGGAALRETARPYGAQAELAAALARAAGGEREGLALVYRLTSMKLFGLCLRILKDRGESEDVLQDVYLTVWRRAGSFDPERGVSPITWLAAIARNKAIDRLRARGPLANAEPVDDLDTPDASPSALEALEGAEALRRLGGCLEELEEKQRLAIRTAFFEGLTYEALAARTSTPLGTVKSWIRRGMLKLRDCLER